MEKTNSNYSDPNISDFSQQDGFDKQIQEPINGVNGEDTDPDDPEWVDKVKREKIANIVNYLFDSSEGEESIDDYFKDRDVDRESIQEFLSLNGLSKEQMMYMFPDLKFDNKELIIKEIEALSDGKFDTKTELIATIAQYLKDHLNYDMHGVINSLQSYDLARSKTGVGLCEKAESIGIKLNEKQRKKLEGGDTKFLDDLIDKKIDESLTFITKNEKIQFPDYFIGFLKDNLDKLFGGKSDKDIIELFNQSPPRVAKTFIKLNNKINKLDNTEFSKWFKYECKKDSNMRKILYDIYKGYLRSGKESLNVGSTTVQELLDAGAGVCRHYSELMQEIYNEMASNYFPNSEMLNVTNAKSSHAYNKILSIEPDGTISEYYVDVTKLIAYGTLFVPEDKIRFAEDEVYN